jgi:hypothetical protein
MSEPFRFAEVNFTPHHGRNDRLVPLLVLGHYTERHEIAIHRKATEIADTIMGAAAGICGKCGEPVSGVALTSDCHNRHEICAACSVRFDSPAGYRLMEPTRKCQRRRHPKTATRAGQPRSVCAVSGTDMIICEPCQLIHACCDCEGDDPYCLS